MANKTLGYLRSLVRELTSLPTEIERVEFKCNNDDPERIARYISGLSNAAALEGNPHGYLVWGIDNDTHEIIGTTFRYRKAKKGNEELEAWLARMINPKINFRFYEVPMEDLPDGSAKTVVLIEIPCAETEPTKYGTVGYIRVGSNLKPLADYPEKEAELWRLFDSTPCELRIARNNVDGDEVVNLLNFSRYYELLGLPVPRFREEILQNFSDEKFIRKNEAGNWDITNLGALLIGKKINAFEALVKRGVRVIQYKGSDRLNGIQEREFTGGYACMYEDIVQFIMAIIPQSEILDGTIRRKEYRFPEIAIRELVANVMIHQALDQRGTNPMVEIFEDRMEFSNAGAPLVAIDRIVDTVPVSRNENMAGFMHRCGICEERGSGYDKIVYATGQNELLAPRIENQNNQFTKVILFAKVPFELTTKEDRIRTCYMQACLAYVQFSSINNADIRRIFGLKEEEKVKASRILKDTVEAGLIKVLDPSTAPRYTKYIPRWA